MYSLVIGQYTDAIIAQVEVHKHYSLVAYERHGINLLQIIKSICFDFQDKKYVAQSIHQAKKRFYAIKQVRHETMAQYYKLYQNIVQVLNQCSGAIGDEDGIRLIVFKTEGNGEATTDLAELILVSDKSK